MKPEPNECFKRNYQALLKHLRLKGLQPATIMAYSHAVKRQSTQVKAVTP